jgi:dihydroflavonol-4-reductase
MQILVTGATGLLGGTIANFFAAKHYSVRAIYRTSSPKNAAANINWVMADILDPTSLQDALQGITHVIHCAAVVSFDKRRAATMHEANVTGTANVVNACIEANVEHLIHISSVAALGRIRNGEVITEAMNWTPETSNSLYGRTKFLAEMEVWRGQEEGLKIGIFNPSIILGLTDWQNSSAKIFKNVYDEFGWYSTGTTGWVDAMDIAKAVDLFLQKPNYGQRYIMSAHNESYQHVMQLMAKYFNKKPPNKKVTPFLASLVVAVEYIKSRFSGKEPLITAETAKTALTKVQYNNQKFLTDYPSFNYTALEDSIKTLCQAYQEKYNLKK